jgi:hypothetical protein
MDFFVIKMSVNVRLYPYPVSNKLIKGCRQILRASHVNEKTKVTMLTSTEYIQQHIVNSYYQAALDLGAETTIIMNEPYKIPGVFGPGSIRVPKATEAALWASDMVVLVGVNMFKTPVLDRIKAEKKPTFFGYNSPASTEWLITRYPPPNATVVKRTHAGVELLTKGNEVRYTTPAGTDLTMGINSKTAHPEVGFLEPDKGHTWDILAGAGMYASFEPESCDGTYVIVAGDYPSQIVDREIGFPYTGDKITFTIREDKITKIEGGNGAKLMRQWFESWNNEDSYVLAHMGIGTDPRPRKDFERYPFYGVSGWDGEWIEGLLCLGVGAGTRARARKRTSHIDFEQRHGSCWIDGEKILEDEKFIGPLSDEALGIKSEDKK